MQVPVYPHDIKRHSFKRLAKTFQKKWPGKQCIRLSAAQEVLARGLGYLSYHALMKEAEVSAYRSPMQSTCAPAPKKHATKITLSSQQLDTLVGHVKARGSLRDNALMEAMVTGARSYDFLGLQKKHLTLTQSSLTVETNDFYWTFCVPSAIALLASQHGADPEEFLFPSKNSKSRPMSGSELNKLYKTWLEGCNLDSSSTPQRPGCDSKISAIKYDPRFRKYKQAKTPCNASNGRSHLEVFRHKRRLTLNSLPDRPLLN
ncbi:hypothetical protein [Pseudomonas putida]|uniref:hypothetical protein n=1 Tax=Pseudomonas putida TaxID=303 RepID=UPI001E4FDE6B|nr:hypothetical protein [Pseudomonas putida]MCC9009426.1 hypothetical protein [Pseudomonas putida]